MSTRRVEPIGGPDASALAISALQESEARFRAMADSAPAPVWVTTATGGVEFVNRAFEDYAGKPKEALVGDAWIGLLHSDDLAEVARRRDAAWATHGPYVFEARFRRADGDWRWMQASSNPRFDADGVFQGYVGLAVDLTEMHAAEVALRESEARFRLISESAPVMLWMGDASGHCVYLNKAQRAFWGLEPDDIATFDWGVTLHPDSAGALNEPFSRGMTEHVAFDVEATYRRIDGEWRILRTQAQPRFDGAGVFLGMIGVNADVTEARRAERDLRGINELLADRVAQAMAEKLRAEEALFHAQKMEAVGRLTGGVAHDFNNLLTVVLGSLDMALGALDDPVKLKRLLTAAMEAGRRGERLTHQLLSFSRRQTLRPTLCDVGELVRGSAGLLSRVVGESVVLEMRLADQPCCAFVDAGQLETALLNLVVNARDAVAEGGRISIETATRLVEDETIASLAAGAYVVVRVIDDGCGMTPEILDRVFEPFFTTKEVGKGTGLGLSQVYGFTQQSGGGLTIASTPGAGATVELYLPLSDQTLDLVPGEPAVVAAPQAATLRVLLVEDDSPVGAVAEEMIVALGHTVARAAEATQALERLREGEPFDVLVTDLVMPGGVNGVALAETASTLDPGLQVLLVSGYVGDGAEEAMAKTPWPFLRKPYSQVDLARLLAAFAPRRAKEGA